LFASAGLGWRFEAALDVLLCGLALIAGQAWGSETLSAC
jgi:hypothetical protein